MSTPFADDATLFSEIAHPTDLQEQSEAAFAHALRLALSAHANLSILHVARAPSEIPWEEFPGVRDLLARWKILDDDASSSDVVALGMGVSKHKVHGDDPAAALATHLEATGTDLIVLATHRRTGLDRWLHHEVARPIARSSGAMTLFVPTDVDGFVSRQTGIVSLDRVLVPVAAAPPAQPAIDAACALLNTLEAGKTAFHLLHVGQPAEFPNVNTPTRQGWEWTREITAGDIVSELQAATESFQPNLIVLTTSGRHGILDMLRGSTTERLLEAVNCPVLAVPVRESA